MWSDEQVILNISVMVFLLGETVLYFERIQANQSKQKERNDEMKMILMMVVIAGLCVGCETPTTAIQNSPTAVVQDSSDDDKDDLLEESDDDKDDLSDEEKQKILESFNEALTRLENSRKGQSEYRVLIVNWANLDDESPDYFRVVNGLTNGGEIWLNGYAADMIDPNWKRFGNSDYEGTFKTLPALINWVGSYGWKLIEVHDSQYSRGNYPEKLYFVKTIKPTKKTVNGK